MPGSNHSGLHQQVARMALAAAIARRYTADHRSLSQIAAETHSSHRAVRDLLAVTGTPLRGSRSMDSGQRRQAAIRTHLRIGYLQSTANACADGGDLTAPAVMAALRAAGHAVISLPDPHSNIHSPTAGLAEHRITALIYELRNPNPHSSDTPMPGLDRAGRSGWLRTAIRQQLPTLIWDLDSQLPPNLSLDQPAHVKIAATTAQTGRLWLPYPAADRLLDDADPHKLIAHPRRRVLATDPAPAGGRPAQAVTPTRAYRDSLAVRLDPPDGHDRLGHHTGQLIHAVTAGCLPLVSADLPDAAELVPAALHLHNDSGLATTVDMITAIAGTEHHRHLLTACLLNLHRYRLADHVPRLLDALQTLTTAATVRPHALGTP
ncbi:hypothetical protein ACQP2X_39435 [Actinoplanes sp. CA-131856]